MKNILIACLMFLLVSPVITNPQWHEVPSISMEDQGYTQTEEKCPYCNVCMLYGPISCPDGMIGCLVLHYGYTCPNCGRQFTKKSTNQKGE